MLNVYDNGIRIVTPWYAVFPPRTTEKLTATAAQREISKQDQVRESTLPHPSIAQKAYEQVEHNSEERHTITSAEQIMSGPVFTLPSGVDLLVAWREFQRHGIRHMPIVDMQNSLCGIVSERDILKARANILPQAIRAKGNLNVDQVMTTQVLAGRPHTSIRELAEAMTVRRIGAIPLLDEQKKIVGIVTRSDILRTIMHQAPMELWS